MKFPESVKVELTKGMASNCAFAYYLDSVCVDNVYLPDMTWGSNEDVGISESDLEDVVKTGFLDDLLDENGYDSSDYDDVLEIIVSTCDDFSEEVNVDIYKIDNSENNYYARITIGNKLLPDFFQFILESTLVLTKGNINNADVESRLFDIVMHDLLDPSEFDTYALDGYDWTFNLNL